MYHHGNAEKFAISFKSLETSIDINALKVMMGIVFKPKFRVCIALLNPLVDMAGKLK
jgi:hypothetical protein